MTATRTIKIPAPLKFKAPTGAVENGKAVVKETEFTIQSLIVWAVDTQPAFTNTISGITAGVRIITALEPPKPSKATKATAPVGIELTVKDWQMLRDALESPAEQPGRPLWPIDPPRALLPFLEAITQA